MGLVFLIGGGRIAAVDERSATIQRGKNLPPYSIAGSRSHGEHSHPQTMHPAAHHALGNFARSNSATAPSTVSANLFSGFSS
jgi:hypothetical protein